MDLLEWFNAMPIMRTLSARAVAVTHASATMLVDPPQEERNPNGAVNGGILAAVCDITGGMAVSAGGDDREYQSTIDLTLHFLRPALATPLRVHAAVLRRGRRNVVVQVEVRDDDGELCTVATGTWVVFPGSPHARATATAR